MRPLKILFLSHSFTPAIGGIEASSELLARAFMQAGHTVIVLTMTSGEAKGLPFKVVRQPSQMAKTKYHAWADLVYENNPCLRLGWPKLLFRKPSVVALHTWINQPDGSVSLADKLKLRWLARAKKVIAVSEAVQQRCWPEAIIIGNSYDSKMFGHRAVERKKDFVFLGRLVSDKGVSLAIQAFGNMVFPAAISGLENATLTIIGDGPDRGQLEALAARFAEPSRIRFVGPLKGEVLVQELNRHSFLFIPSIWEEPFGIVALEGIACGLIPIASDGGGLPDAVGRAGVIFERGQLASLIQVSTGLLTSNEQQHACLTAAPAHLEKFGMSKIVRAFIDVIESAAIA